MRVTVKTAGPEKRSAQITLAEHATIGVLQLAVRREFSFEGGALQLIHSGRMLTDPEELLESLGIQTGAHLFCMHKESLHDVANLRGLFEAQQTAPPAVVGARLCVRRDEPEIESEVPAHVQAKLKLQDGRVGLKLRPMPPTGPKLPDELGGYIYYRELVVIVMAKKMSSQDLGVRILGYNTRTDTAGAQDDVHGGAMDMPGPYMHPLPVRADRPGENPDAQKLAAWALPALRFMYKHGSINDQGVWMPPPKPIPAEDGPRVTLSLSTRLPTGPVPPPGLGPALVHGLGHELVARSYVVDRGQPAAHVCRIASEIGELTRQCCTLNVNADVWPPPSPDEYALSNYVMPALRYLSVHEPVQQLDETPAEKPPAPIPEPGEPLVGEAVVLRGLNARPELNGRRGMVTRWVGEKGRYEVLLLPETDEAKPGVPQTLSVGGSKKVLLRAANLRVDTAGAC
jgi:hypothetical protein